MTVRTPRHLKRPAQTEDPFTGTNLTKPGVAR